MLIPSAAAKKLRNRALTSAVTERSCPPLEVLSPSYSTWNWQALQKVKVFCRNSVDGFGD
jgi:hypothetical protein